MRNLKRTLYLTILSALWAATTYGQTANFTAAVASGCAPLIVNFQDQSTGNPTSWLWDFGNGATSTLKNPSTTYFATGTYSVKLTVKGPNGTNTITRSQYITVYGKPTVAFTVSDSAGCFPYHVQFTDLSGASNGTTNTGWLWDFGDGTQSSQQNPADVYTNSGNYAVTLKVTNDKGCYSALTKISYIKITGGITSDFKAVIPTTCHPPFNVQFTNNTSGPGTLTYNWDFGDGTTSSSSNPGHTYSQPGNYTVSLTTNSSNGCSDTVTKPSVLTFQNVSTSFSAPDSICINSAIAFQNTSTPNPTASKWIFGDGTTSSQVSPVKSYATPNTYTISLYNTYGACTDTVQKNIKVNPRPVAAFTADSTFKCQPSLQVNFKDQSTNAVSWFWDFGDSTNSSAQNPQHIYTTYGSFNVRLVVTNASGCTDTIVKKAYIKVLKPIINFLGLPAFGCLPYTLKTGVNVNTPDVVTSYLWSFGDGSAPVPGKNPPHLYTVQGSYTATLTITTSTGCTITDSLVGAVNVGTKPKAGFYAVPNPVCALKRIQFTDTSTASPKNLVYWQWAFGDGSTSVDQNPYHIYKDTGSFDVQLIVSNSGCRDTTTVANYVTVQPPIPKYTFRNDCNNRLLFYFSDQSIVSAGATYSWNFGDNTQLSSQQSPQHVFPAYGTYTVSLTVSNGSCSNVFSLSVNVFNVQPDFSANITAGCKPLPVTFSTSNINGSNISNYSWNYGDGNITGNSTPTVTFSYLVSGTYTVTLTTTDTYGCMQTVSKNNYIHISGPTARFTSVNVNGCQGLTATFTDGSQSDGTNAITSWNWNFGDGSSQNSNGGSVQHTYSKAGTYTVKLGIGDAGGCTDTATAQNLVHATNPKASFTTADTAACPGSIVHFTNNTNSPSYQSVWSFSDSSSSTVQNPTNSYTTPGTYTVKLNITDQYGCSDSLTKPNYIKVARPVASFTVNDSISSCTPFQVQFTNTSVYYKSSLWNLGGGTSTLTSPVQYYTIPGTYPIKLLVTSPGGCQDSAFKTITVYDTTGSSIVYASKNGCKPLSIDFSTFSSGPVTFTWDFGDGNLVTDGSSINHVYHSFGDFIPKVILTDPSGCIIPITGSDTLHIIGANAKFGLDKHFYCDSGWVNFSDSTTYNDSLRSYSWNFGDGAISQLQSPSHQYTAPGIYSVSLSVSTVSNCTDTFTLDSVIKIVQSPKISISGDSIICVNNLIQSVGINLLEDTSAIQWSWQFPNGNSSNVQNPPVQQYANPGQYSIVATATNSSGCKDTAIQSILVDALPVITVPSAITLQEGSSITIPATYSSGIANYSWTPDTALSCTNCAQPVAAPKFSTKYMVTVTDSNGCKNSSQVQIVVVCKNANVFVPNTFSPNGDGINDIFYVRGRGLDRVKLLRIFNRWGEVVFERINFPVNDPAFGWDGKFKGNKPQPGVYIYQVEVFCENSQIIHFEGNVALIQ